MLPNASVIMSVWNGGAYLSQAIDSVQKQTIKEFEFVIVDDGSTDNTPSILADRKGRDSRLRIYRRDHQGMVSSFNFAAAMAQGEYLIHLDADDISLPDRLEKQLAFMGRNPQVGVLGAATRAIWPDGGIIQDTVYPTTDAAIRVELERSFCFCHSALMMRRSLFSAIGGYRASFEYAEDLDLILRFAEHCEMANLDEVLILYRIHGNQVCARNVGQQILSGIGARIAAELRIRGDSDQALLQESHISRATLQRLGVTGQEIDRRILGALEHHLRLALADSRPAGFEQEVEEVVSRVRQLSGQCDVQSLDRSCFPLIAKVLEPGAGAAEPR